jgi:hypothetical protein
MKYQNARVDKLEEKVPSGEEVNELVVIRGEDTFSYYHVTKDPLEGGQQGRQGQTLYPMSMLEEVAEYVNKKPRYVKFV